MAWEDLAACAGMDTKMFYPEESIGGPRKGSRGDDSRDRMRVARQACARCPVRLQCLMFAIESDQWGIWGGMDRAERKKYAAEHDLI